MCHTILTYLIARYMGRMAKRGKVCTLIMMVMKAMYSNTLMKPGTGEGGSISLAFTSTDCYFPLHRGSKKKLP